MFRELARVAQASHGEGDIAAAVSAYAGPLLPEDLYESWTGETRDELRATYLGLLRSAGRWDDVVAEDPTDEDAHLALARADLDRGDLRAAERQLERLDHALLRELGTRPSAAAEELRERLRREPADPTPAQGVQLVGRRAAGDRVRAALAQAETGRGTTLLVSGPPGVGKTAVLGLADALARRQGWRSGRGTASAVEGPWPYATVLEAFADLCRQHPALLDGLDDAYYAEIERALSGKDVVWSGESGHQRLFVAVAELMRLAATGHGLLLLVDDLQDADEASLRLLHYLSRCAMTEPVLIVVAHRPRIPETARQVEESLVRKGAGARLELGPLDATAVRRLLSTDFAGLGTARVEEIVQASGGLPFAVLELARSLQDDDLSGVPALSLPTTETFQRLALLGGCSPPTRCWPSRTRRRTTPTAGSRRRCRRTSSSRRRRATGSVIRCCASDWSTPCRRTAAWPPCATSPRRWPGSVGLRRVSRTCSSRPGSPSRAVPYAIRAVETAGALGAYRDALTMIDAVRDHASPDDLPRLLARRGDLLQALGDPDAVAAYLEAVPVTDRHRAPAGAGAARAGCRPGRSSRGRGRGAGGPRARGRRGGRADPGGAGQPRVLLRRRRGRVADRERGQRPAAVTRRPDGILDLVTLQGLVAHTRGEWFERFQVELRRTRGSNGSPPRSSTPTCASRSTSSTGRSPTTR